MLQNEFASPKPRKKPANREAFPNANVNHEDEEMGSATRQMELYRILEKYPVRPLLLRVLQKKASAKIYLKWKVKTVPANEHAVQKWLYTSCQEG